MVKLKNIITEIENDQLHFNVQSLEHNLEREFPELEEIRIYMRSCGALHIDGLKVKEKFRSSGIGEKVMKRILDFADATNLIVTLHAAAQSRYKAKLLSFYKNLGFVENKGKNRDYHISSPFSMTMYRRPKSSLKEIMNPHEKAKSTDKERGYIGIVKNGRVYGYNEMVPHVFQTLHAEIEFGAPNDGKFRYLYLSNVVYWNKFPPTDEERLVVEDWLAKKKVKVKSHRSVWDKQGTALPPIINL